MVVRIFLIVCVAYVFNLASCFKAPFPGFRPCKDHNEECLLENAINGAPYFADGIPELGVKRMDPDFFEKVDSSSPNLKFILTDVTAKGIKSCKPISLKHNANVPNIVLQLQCSLMLDGNYEMDGRVLIVKIAGKGKIHVYLRNVINTVTLDYVIKEGKDGKQHIRVKKFHHTYELKDKSDVVFDGLFQENAVLNQAADDLIKNNGNDVIKEIGGEMFKASITRIVENFNRFFGKIDYKDMIIE